MESKPDFCAFDQSKSSSHSTEKQKKSIFINIFISHVRLTFGHILPISLVPLRVLL